MRRSVRERRRVWGREGEKAAARPVPSATPLPPVALTPPWPLPRAESNRDVPRTSTMHLP